MARACFQLPPKVLTFSSLVHAQSPAVEVPGAILQAGRVYDTARMTQAAQAELGAPPPPAPMMRKARPASAVRTDPGFFLSCLVLSCVFFFFCILRSICCIYLCTHQDILD